MNVLIFGRIVISCFKVAIEDERHEPIAISSNPNPVPLLKKSVFEGYMLASCSFMFSSLPWKNIINGRCADSPCQTVSLSNMDQSTEQIHYISSACSFTCIQKFISLMLKYTAHRILILSMLAIFVRAGHYKASYFINVSIQSETHCCLHHL